LTVDVEDWYDGMRTLGYDVPPSGGSDLGLGALSNVLGRYRARITLFVVGRNAMTARDELCALAADGHEIGCHGPDHGRLPTRAAALDDWLRRGRESVEDVVGVPVLGFRSPRFEVPANMTLAAFRDAIARAGFAYTSDASSAGPSAAVLELPIASWGRFRFGGGSYQRLIPRYATASLVHRFARPAVTYYHSYDFGKELPGLGNARSVAVATQILGRSRVPAIFEFLLARLGSQTCLSALRGTRVGMLSLPKDAKPEC
jgi:peptidoglycan/xylan/chitin deacetylase (PgdA/CDA1 family)